MNMREISGKLDAQGECFALVASRFNNFITERLIEGAVDCIVRHGGNAEDITLIRVPGSFEIVAAARAAAESGRYSAIIALGALIRGATPHFDFIAKSLTSGMGALAAEGKTVITFGVLTTDSVEQAIERAGTKSGNKGFDAALAAIEMVHLLGQIRGSGQKA
jgi:6,7-dimethyl-8-ribityllumazine synthase